jgi:hypothetical protein
MVFKAWDIIPHCQPVEMGEALGCLESLKLATSLTNGDILLETDCSSLLKVFFILVLWIGPRLASLQKNDPISLCCRKVNGVAHNLSQHGRRELCRGVMENNAPSCVSGIFLQECKNSLLL